MYINEFSKIFYSSECDVLLDEIKKLRDSFTDWSYIIKEAKFLDAIAVYPEYHDNKIRIQGIFEDLDKQNVLSKEAYLDILDNEVNVVTKALQDAEKLENYERKENLCLSINNYLVKVEIVRRDIYDK